MPGLSGLIVMFTVIETTSFDARPRRIDQAGHHIQTIIVLLRKKRLNLIRIPYLGLHIRLSAFKSFREGFLSGDISFCMALQNR